MAVRPIPPPNFSNWLDELRCGGAPGRPKEVWIQTPSYGSRQLCKGCGDCNGASVNKETKPR